MFNVSLSSKIAKPVRRQSNNNHININNNNNNNNENDLQFNRDVIPEIEGA